MKREQRNNVVVEKALAKVWGRPMSKTDLRICKTLGWATREHSAAKVIWRATNRVEDLGVSVHTKNELTAVIADRALIGDLAFGELEQFRMRIGGAKLQEDLIVQLALLDEVARGEANVLKAGDT